jgi:hypothetical protein
LPEIIRASDGGTDGRVICHFDFEGERIFQHRIAMHWRLHGRNPHVPGALLEGQCQLFIDELRRDWPGRTVQTRDSTSESERLHETLVREAWLMRVIELQPDRRENQAQGGKSGNPDQYYEVRFFENGSLGDYSLPEVTYWELQKCDMAWHLRLFSDDGGQFADLLFSETNWSAGDR